MFDNISFSRFNAYFTVQKPLELPPYTGSAFRGVLGHAMRKVRYGMKKQCEACPVRPQCRYENLYAYLFESPRDHPYLVKADLSQNIRQEKNYPRPFVLDPPAGGAWKAGDMLCLSFTLVGRAISCFPFMACALGQMNSIGFGAAQGNIFLEAITDGFPSEDGGETVIYDGETGVIVGPGQIFDFNMMTEWAARRLYSEGHAERFCVLFLTPFRFKDRGSLGRSLSFNVFMRNVLRRLTFLSVHSPLSFDINFEDILDRARSVKIVTSDLRWYDWQRYSARQKTKMNLGGLVGEVVFSGELDEFLPYVRLCEFLNVGKSCTFGLGKYELKID
ncbi:CRISPR system precrRNA processing endoribonuclease RAMP protein Cas6 [Desulfonema magnum]|uniref:CRISPR-associated endoribonuclease Cas6 C-terminal domain-containing protein n=1 Tax=Desulfonema magnum TaxID=45655 RepID=A0A975GQS2_9BACT|nr:CRISPR system precrRNA processing endoribonuclease RAMP protein Cas6 [Desulfonema magnum]QTA89248.1 CRISPR-associated endoribonuclease Cas6 C-terminal domain-containing protein [Desulfonema magnum]